MKTFVPGMGFTEVTHEPEAVIETDHSQHALEAYEFLETYKGSFDFLLDIKARVEADHSYSLTERQVEAILNCKSRETSKPGQGSGVDLSTLPVGTRYYAVVNGSDQLSFFRVDHIDRGDWTGWMFVRHIVGGHEDRRIGKQRPGKTYEGEWPALLQKVIDDPMIAMETYGKEIGQCGWCGKHLTDPVSRMFGIGPVCRGEHWS